MTRDEQLKRIAADMFNSETRRGWIINNCSAAGNVDPDITELEYIERFGEQNKDRDIDELEELANDARPSNSLTAHEREIFGDVLDALARRMIEMGENETFVAGRAEQMVRGWEYFSSNTVDDRGHETCRDWMDPEIVRLLDQSLDIRYGVKAT